MLKEKYESRLMEAEENLVLEKKKAEAVYKTRVSELEERIPTLIK